MSSDTRSPSVEMIVHEFISSRLREKGFNGWSPVTERGVSEGGMSERERERVHGSLRRLTEELVSLSGDQIKEMSDRLAHAVPFSSLDYSSFQATAAELFADGIRWSHILTLLVFSSELALSQPVSASSDSISTVAAWCSQYISSPPILSWINDHGGWEGLVTYENERNSSDENNHRGDDAPDGPRLASETSSNALIGLGGAISMVLAGITYLVARH